MLDLLRIVVGPQEVQGDVRLVPDDPAVVRLRRNVEKLARSQLHHSAIRESSGSRAREHQADVLDGAVSRTHTWPYMRRPTPPRLVGRATDREAAEVHQFEATFDHLSDLVGGLEPLQYDVNHRIADLRFMCVRHIVHRFPANATTKYSAATPSRT